MIQWAKSWIPSNSLACLNGLALDAAERRVLGEEVDIEVHAYDECNTVIPFGKIRRRLEAAGAGLVCLVGVQSNQYPRAMDIARQFREHGLPVVIGGFHVSGCLSMLPELTPELKDALEMGISLFAGEGEGRFGELLSDADRGELQPIYNYMSDLPSLDGAVTPFLPEKMVRRYVGSFASFDSGRGCPFQCSFCTIINVQGRKSRYRSEDDVEHLIRTGLSQGTTRYFITDDNFARNKNWEAILDRLAELRRERDGDLGFMIQVDTLAHKIPGFVEKCAAAGVSKVFIGLESVNPTSLKAAKKNQNRIGEYRRMLQMWREVGVVSYAGYILGFPDETPETIERDIKTIQQELPLDLLEFFYLTPLPGSADHKAAYLNGERMDDDLNKYDLEHVVADHPRMSKETWESVYHRAWDQYYSLEHVERLMRRAAVGENAHKKTARLAYHVAQFYGTLLFERVHPLQGGYLRRKIRTQRRHGLPREGWLTFWKRRLGDVVRTYGPLPGFVWKILQLRKQILADPHLKDYMDAAIAPVVDDDLAAAAEPADCGDGGCDSEPTILPLVQLTTPLGLDAGSPARKAG